MTTAPRPRRAQAHPRRLSADVWDWTPVYVGQRPSRWGRLLAHPWGHAVLSLGLIGLVLLAVKVIQMLAEVFQP